MKRSTIKSVFTPLILAIFLSLVAACDDDPTSPGETDEPDGPNGDPQIELTSEDAARMLYEYLVERGIIPENEASKITAYQQTAGFEGDKFIEVGESDTGDFVLRLYYDSNGSIIPNSDWYGEQSNFCAELYRLERAPDLFLEIEIDLSAEMMRMDLKNADTNESIKSHESEIFDQDDWFIEMIEEMFLEFDDENIFGAFEAECGLFEGPVSIVFDSKMEAEIISPDLDAPMIINTAVISEIELEYSEEHEQYIGEATLSHRLYENSMVDMLIESGINCDVNLTDAVMQVELNASEFTTVSDLVLYITSPTNGEKAPWAIIQCEGFDELDMDFAATFWFASFVLFHEDHVADNRDAFKFTDMEPANIASGLIGYHHFEQSMDLTDFDSDFDGQESMPVTETTWIEIRPLDL